MGQENIFDLVRDADGQLAFRPLKVGSKQMAPERAIVTYGDDGSQPYPAS